MHRTMITVFQDQLLGLRSRMLRQLKDPNQEKNMFSPNQLIERFFRNCKATLRSLVS